MAVLEGTFETFDASGNQEDFSDRIFIVSPIKTPFMSVARKIRVRQKLHQWQTQSLAAAAANQVIEGDVITHTTPTATTVLSNTTQLSDKEAAVTSSQEASNHYGRRSEMGLQIALRAFELKRDMENDLLSNTAEAAGASGTARVSAGVPTWITTNTSNGTGGTDAAGTGNDTRTDGTQRDLTESLLKNVLKQCFDSGGDPDCIMVGSFNKQQISGFGGNATRFKTAEDRTLMAAIDLYESDFGDLQVIPNRFMRARDCLVLEKRMWAIGFLQPFKVEDLAKTGHNERKMLSVEYVLEASNEAASGAVWDCTTS